MKFQEFFETSSALTAYIEIDRMKFIGNGLDEEYNLTLQELVSTGRDGTFDVELISKYLKTITKQRDQELTNGYAELAEIESDKAKGPLSKDWVAIKRRLLLMPYTCM